MPEPDRAAVEAVEAVEASREEYVGEALLEAVRSVVVLYRSGGGELPAHVGALDRLAAAYEAYTRVAEAVEDTTESDPSPR